MVWSGLQVKKFRKSQKPHVLLPRERGHVVDPQAEAYCVSCSRPELSPFCAAIQSPADWVTHKQGSLCGAIVVAAVIPAIRSGGRRNVSLRLHSEGKSEETRV